MINKVSLYLTTAIIALTVVKAAERTGVELAAAASPLATIYESPLEHDPHATDILAAARQLSGVSGVAYDLHSGLEDIVEFYRLVKGKSTRPFTFNPDTLPPFRDVMAAYLTADEHLKAANRSLTNYQTQAPSLFSHRLSEATATALAEHPEARDGAASSDVSLALASVLTMARQHISPQVAHIKASMAEELEELRRAQQNAKFELQKALELAERWNSILCLQNVNRLREATKLILDADISAMQQQTVAWQRLMVEKLTHTVLQAETADVDARLGVNTDDYTTLKATAEDHLQLLDVLNGYGAILKQHLQTPLVFADADADAEYGNTQPLLTTLRVLNFLLPNLQRAPSSFPQENITKAFAYITQHQKLALLEDKQAYLREVNASTQALLAEAQAESLRLQTALSEKEAAESLLREEIDDIFSNKMNTERTLDEVIDELHRRALDDLTATDGYEAEAESEEEDISPLSILSDDELETKRAELEEAIAHADREYEAKDAEYTQLTRDYHDAWSKYLNAEDAISALEAKLDADTSEAYDVDDQWATLQLTILRITREYEDEDMFFNLPIPHAMSAYRLGAAAAEEEAKGDD